MGFIVEKIEFGLGLNTKDVDFDLLSTQSSDLGDVVFSARGSIESRAGRTQYASTVAGSDPCISLGKYSYSSGTGTTTNSAYAVFNTDIWKNVAGTWTAQSRTLTDATPGQFVEANNELYYFNGTEAVQNLSNTTWSSLASGTPMSGSNNIGRYGVYKGEMMFVAGTNAFPDRVYVSGDADGSLGTPEDFSGNGVPWAYDIGTNDGSGKITGLIQLNNYVVVLKEKGIYIMAGATGDTQTIDARVVGTGCVAPKSIATDGDFVYFLSADKHVYAFDGATIWKISEVIETTTQEDQDDDNLSNAAGVYDSVRNYYILGVTAETETVNSFCLIFDISASVVQTKDYNQHVWTVAYNWPANCWLEFAANNDEQPSLIMGDSGNTGKTFTAFSGTSDDGDAINAYYVTKSYDLGANHREKQYKYFTVDCLLAGGWNMHVEYAVNGGEFAGTAPSLIDLTPDGAVLPFTLSVTLADGYLSTENMVRIPAKSRYIKFKWYVDGVDESFQIFSANLQYRIAKNYLRLSTAT